MRSVESNTPNRTKNAERDRLVDVASREGAEDNYGGKRADLRFAAGMLLDVSTDPDDPSALRSVQMHNVSESGFSFWSKQRLSYNSNVYVREFSGGEPRPWLAGRVTHCTVGIRGYLVGACFVDES